MKTLPKLAQHLGPRVPSMQLVSEGPTTVVYKKLVGMHADEAPDGAWPEQLGGLLARLHAINPAALGLESLDTDTLRDDARAETKKWLGIGGVKLGDADCKKAEQLIADYLGTTSNWHFKPSAIHGDLGPENVIVSPAGELVGVIDWEECRTGDPAWDFGWWLNAKPELGNRILEAYGGAPDDTFRRRAKIAYALMPWDEVEHGANTGDDSLVQSGLAGVRARIP
jgi:aminoglycoside phosphotransferase (APT) family kinase protein